MHKRTKILVALTLLLIPLCSFAETGYKLWLRYEPVMDEDQADLISSLLGTVRLGEGSPTYEAIKKELELAARGMVGSEPGFYGNGAESGPEDGARLIIGTPATCTVLDVPVVRDLTGELGPEGYYIGRLPGGNGEDQNNPLIIVANEPVGALYGTFHLLRVLQTGRSLEEFPVSESPLINHRILDHWDNLNRTVERGYAGFSLWDWHRLPDYLDQRYVDYARANASIGINGTVLTNVNANALVLTPDYIGKVAALADLFRPYGIRVYLTARFNAPMELDRLPTADPLDPQVQEWWKKKADEIYRAIPDFGGFLVKANSEGQPGPQNYERSHADGANMLADAVAPHGGIVMWRAFVYKSDVNVDRAMQANLEFVPFDGKFRDNVVIQVKNGPIDFQPREPFHPLFGSMPKTALALEVQITQEYLGQGTQLVYLGPLFEECLDSDTYQPGKGSTVARIVDGSLDGHAISVMAGVSNIGNDINWTGHFFGQSNWYVFGRLAWDPFLSSGDIADEWIRLTYGNDPTVVETIHRIMMQSREAAVNYMTPLGLHHIMGAGHHYGPGPWVSRGRPDWTAVYYHKADSLGIGFDRTASGSNALSLYAPELRQKWSDPESCPDKFLLWFHHLPWDYPMKSGRSLWDELCDRYDEGVRTVREMEESWKSLKGSIDEQRYEGVRMLLIIQEKEAAWWRNACLLYFQQFSKRPFPAGIEQPEGDLQEFMRARFRYAPGR